MAAPVSEKVVQVHAVNSTLGELSMKKGKYFRFGEYDTWIGYEGEDLGKIRFEWLGTRLSSYEVRLDLRDPPQEQSTQGSLTFKCRSGVIEIRVTPSAEGEARLLITHKWWFLPVFWAKGSIGRHEADDFIKAILSLNPA